MDGMEVWEGDFCETYDSNGLRWTAYIKRIRGSEGTFDYFHSNWDVRLYNYWTRRKLKVIKRSPYANKEI